MTTREAEHLSRKTIRSPVGHGNLSAVATDPGQLRRDPIRVGSEHGSKHGHDHIEMGVRKRQLFRIALLKGYLQAFGCSPCAGLFQQVGCDVDTRDHCAFAGSRDGQVAGAAGDVQYLHRRLDAKRVNEQLSLSGSVFGNLSEVAGHPGGTHFFFQWFQLTPRQYTLSRDPDASAGI